MKTKSYKSATAFRTALEERLRNINNTESTDIPRLRRHVAFDRLLARLFTKPHPPWILKGGYAMELRMSDARVTKDIDLAMKEEMFSGDKSNQSSALLEVIQKFAKLDLNDFFEYIIEPPIMDLEAAPYGGARFPVEAKMDERTFSKFHLDVGIGDVWMEPLESLLPREWLDFAGLKTGTIPVTPKEQQFAEKIHAYTLPREEGKPNSRVKDLVDMILLITNESLDLKKISQAINSTFQRRSTHEFPNELPYPPDLWKKSFVPMATECGITLDLDSAYQILNEFIKKVPQ